MRSNGSLDEAKLSGHLVSNWLMPHLLFERSTVDQGFGQAIKGVYIQAKITTPCALNVKRQSIADSTSNETKAKR